MIRTLVIASLLFELMGLSYHDRLNSDVVILGTLESMHREISGVTERNTGTVRVSRVFAGDVKAGQTIEIFWTNRTDFACRVSHERLKDAEALWFLKRSEE